MIRTRRTSCAVLCVGAVLVGVCSATAEVYWEGPFDFTPYNAPTANLETMLGPRIQQLDAKAAGFDFGNFMNPFRNFNCISEVYQADRQITIGTGVNGTSIVMQPGDLTFAYTLDYTGTIPGVDQTALTDFQLARIILDDHLFRDALVDNPGPHIALEYIIAGGYNTNTASGFNAKALKDYDEGIRGEISDWRDVEIPYASTMVQFSWPMSDQLMPGEKAMVFLFCHDVTYMQIGVADGSTYEGGNALGGGTGPQFFPVLIPVPVPEPMSLAMLALGGVMLHRRRGISR
jgi:hypothetical protein